MNKVKILIAFAVILICLLIFCSCRCIPSGGDWYIYEIYHDVEYANGQTLRTKTDANIHLASPTGIHSGQVNIEFFEDGTLIFKPYDSDTLKGTFELKHNRYQNTNFTATFENGERIEDGFAVSYYGGRDLEFTFRGIKYVFGDYGGNSTSENYYEAEMRGLIDTVRNGHYDLYDGVVENGKLISERLNSDIDLYQSGLAVTTVHISSDNELTILDEIREGECVFTQYGQLYVDGIEYLCVVIYYVDPLSEELPPEEPTALSIFDAIDDLEYYFEHPENVILMVSKEPTPVQIGRFNEYLFIDETKDIEAWLGEFYKLKLIQEENSPYDIDSNHIKYGVHLSDRLDKYADIIVYYECGMIYVDGAWYVIEEGSFPTWYGGRATLKFSCNDNMMHINGTDVYYSIENLEFELDSKQDYGYEFDKTEILLVGEIGEILVYDATHFYYNGKYYIVTGEQNFCCFFTTVF